MWSGRNFTSDFWGGGVDPTSKDGSALETHPGRGSASKSFNVCFSNVLNSFCAFSCVFLCFGRLLHVFACFCVFFCSWGALGRSWSAPGRSWDALGALWGRSWPLLGALGALWRRSWSALGRSWDALGALLGKNTKKNLVALRLWGCFGEGFWKGFRHLEGPCKEPSFT